MKGWKLNLLIVLLATTSAYAADTTNSCKLGRQTLPSLTCFGPAKLEKTVVTAATQVEGDLTATSVTLDSMMVDGAVNLHESTVKGLAQVFGNVKAHNVDFENDLDATTDKITLDATKVDGSLVVNSADNTPHLQVVCGTKITGSVTFVGKPGVVQMTDDGDVQGKINNGKLEFINMSCDTKKA